MITSVFMNPQEIQTIENIKEKYGYNTSSAIRYLIKSFDVKKTLIFKKEKDKIEKQIISFSADSETITSLKKLSDFYGVSRSKVVEKVVSQFNTRN